MFSLLESALCLWIQVHPLWIQGLKRLVLWTQNLTLLENQGLSIQAAALYCSYAKAASLLKAIKRCNFASRNDRKPDQISTLIVDRNVNPW